MKELRNKIRNGIANSYRLRHLAKDEKLTYEEKERIMNIVKENDKKIKYYMMMSKLLDVGKEEKNQYKHK